MSAAERPYRLGRHQTYQMVQADDVLVAPLGRALDIIRWSVWLIEPHRTMRHIAASNISEFRNDSSGSVPISQIGRWDVNDYLVCRGALADALHILYHHNQLDALKRTIERIIEENIHG